MSPVFILSRLCLKRRFQFLGICVPPPVRAFNTLLTICSSITLRRPTASAFSVGTFTVISLWRILIVMYSRFCPSTVRDSFFTTVPAPCCGYTTLSPTLYKPTLPFGRLHRQNADGVEPVGDGSQYTESCPKRPLFPGIFGIHPKKPCSERTPRCRAVAGQGSRAAGTGRPGCAP